MQSRAISIAENIVSFIEENMLDPNTMHLNRTWRNGYSGPRAQADDHAFFIRGISYVPAQSTGLMLTVRFQWVRFTRSLRGI